MNRITAPALLAAAIVLGSAIVARAQERIATNDTYNEFPRWHMLVNAFNAQNGSGSRVYPGQASMAQDPQNVLHAAGTLTVSGGGNQVFYINNRPHSRRGNGFSAPYQVSSAGSGYSCHDVEIAALSDGSIVVLWVEAQSGGTENVKHRTWTPSGWGSVSTGITGASGETFTCPRRRNDCRIWS